MLETISLLRNSQGGEKISIIKTSNDKKDNILKNLSITKNKGLYLWTYEDHIELIEKSSINDFQKNYIITENDKFYFVQKKGKWIKPGQFGQNTPSGISPIETISGYMSGQSNKIIILDIFITENPYDLEQKAWHQNPIFFGKKVIDGVGTEKINDSISNLRYELKKHTAFDDNYKLVLNLYPHQIEADEMIDFCFASDDKKCLLAHKPRAGKTYITIHNIRKNRYKNTIILTAYPILNYQWLEAIESFKGFLDFNIIIGSDSEEITLNPDKNNILLLSLQDVKGGNEVFSKDKFKKIKNINFDLLVIDEIHYGVETEKTHEFLDKIKYERLLGLSATPTKNILSGRFSPEQIHFYGMAEELVNRTLYPDLYKNPDINFLIWNLTIDEKNNLKYFSDEEQFNFDKFFRIEENEFYYKSDIQFLFKKIIGDRSVCSRDKLGTLYPFKNSLKFSSVKSILLFVPNISSQYKLKELLEEIDSYEDFNIHVTNSQENSSKKLIKKIKGEFKSSDKRSLIIAVDQLTTGITLEDCDMVAMMNDWKSVDRYVQASFRGQSPRKDKKDCWVIDFNASRSFTLMYEYQSIISKNNGKTVTENIKDWVECVNIFNRVDGELLKIDFNGFNEEYSRLILEKPRFNHQTDIYQDRINEQNIKSALKALGISGGLSSEEKKLNDDGIDSGKSKQGNNDSKSSKKESNKDVSITKLLEIAKALINKTMLLNIFTKFKYDNLDDCFYALENDLVVFKNIDKTGKEMFLETLLLGMNDVDKVDISLIKFIYDNLFNKDSINKKMYLFNQKVNLIYNIIRENPEDIIMKRNLVELIDSYLKPSNTEKRLLGEVFTPMYDKPGCVEEQLNMVDESFWKRKDVRVLDPCAGIGNYSVVLVDKFMKGLIDEIPDSKERLKWILEEIIYIIEYQSKNLFIYLQIFDSENKYKMNYYRGDYLKTDIKEVFGVNEFDLTVMNSPYQEMDGGNGASAIPLYNKFIEKGIKDSKKVISINPSRWFGGGRGLDSFRKNMIESKKIRKIRHFNNSKDVFGQNIEITGGVSYFLYDNNYTGECNLNGKLTNLSKYDIILLKPESSSILDKLAIFPSIKEICLSSSYYRIRNSNINLVDQKEENTISCFTSKQQGFEKFISKFLIKSDYYFYKVFTPRANGDYPKFGNIFIGEQNTISTDTYISFKVDTLEQANFLVFYLNTKFCNFLLSLRKVSQDIKPDTCKWIPLVPFDREWTDELLFDYFNLSEEERNIILNYDKK
jgi:superfamily II DNA or RNA helicase